MLYLVATPIGNLQEFSPRAQTVLQEVEYILCEDTRTSSVLLNNYHIKKPLQAYHKFNETEQLNSIVQDLQAGKDVALISDAGMPGISDPGNILVNKLKELGLPYTVISGPSAFLNAFVLSGFAAPFTFVGFLPGKPSDKKQLLKQLQTLETTLIFYCSPYDLKGDLKDLYAVLGERDICVVRELTKKFETVSFHKLSEGYDGKVKGEFVVVVDKPQQNDSPLNALSVEEHLDFYINLGYKKSDAIEMVARERGMKKNEVYKHTFDIPVTR